VFLKSVNQDTHAVIPELNAAIMESSGKQRLRRVECKPWAQKLRDENRENCSGQLYL
jgi:hypothetical protein